MARRDRRDSIRRRRAFRAPRPRFLIVCEGMKTEPGYFRAMRHLERSLIELELVSPGEKPKALVERAVAMKKEAAARAKREKTRTAAHDQVWCVFDVDEHPYLPEAKHQARDNGIEVAVSNPCFELWALLHFCDQTAHIEWGRLTTDREAIPATTNNCPTSQLHPLYAEALQRAMALDEWQRSRDCAEANPSTGVYRLMEQIRTLGKPVN